ncbi:DUF2877 domain-containing protein [Paraburkholderia hospita]|uniref:oxamate carbamoyltransferase subunit AllH family protein n=1 Tax=Paraburkholderia hospita TaxID=169430 RepID=UPI003B75C7E8
MDLHAARQLLQGVGNGLTPTGDDVLAGLVLFVRWAAPQSPVPAEVAHDAATTTLSRTFLAWAARGQSVQPVHDVVEAAKHLASATGTTISAVVCDRFERAVAVAASIGGTSGKGMLAGLGLAASACLHPPALKDEIRRTFWSNAASTSSHRRTIPQF